MKLLMISGDRTLARGKKGAFYNTLEEFHKYWDRVDIICPAVTTANRQPPTANLFGNVYIHPSPWPLIFQPLWILKMGRELYREHKFDIVTTHEYPPFYNGIGARMLWNKIHVPYLLEIHHVPGHPRAASSKEWFYKVLTRWFIKYDAAKAKAVRVVNRHQVPDFLVKAGVPQNKIKYIASLYIDPDIFKPMPLEKKYDLIFVGRLEKNKGMDLFLRTVRILNDPNSKFYIPNSKSIIVGDGPERKKVEKLVTSYQLPVTSFGWAKDSPEIARLMNESRVLVMPSYNEGGPRVVLEAMACGVPVVATSVGIMIDLVLDKEAGELADWSSDSVAKKVHKILEDPALYDKYSRAGIELAKKFEKDSAVKNFAEQLQDLLPTARQHR